MADVPQYKSVTDPIADDRWAYVSPDGKLKTLRIIVGRPRPWPGDDKGDWVCPVVIEHVTPGVKAIAGVGSVDSLMNAVAVVKAFSDEIGDTFRESRPTGPLRPPRNQRTSRRKRRD